MKKRLFLAALCMLGASGAKATPGKEPGVDSSEKSDCTWSEKFCQWRDSDALKNLKKTVEKGAPKFAAFGPFHLGFGKKDVEKKRYSLRNQSIAFKVIVIGWAANKVRKKIKKAFKKKKHKKHHKHS